DDRERLMSVLHDLGVIQIEPIGPEALGFLSPERGSDRQRSVGDALIRFRALASALPPSPTPAVRSFADLDEILSAARAVPIDLEVAELKRTEDRLLSEGRARRDEAALLTRFSFYGDRLEWLHARRVLAFFGEADPKDFARFSSALTEEKGDVVAVAPGDPVRFLIAVRSEHAEAVARLAQEARTKLSTVPPLLGPIAEEVPKLLERADALDREVAAIRARLGELGTRWYAEVVSIEEALTIENHKFEQWTRFGSTSQAFALEGWVPKRERLRLEAAIDLALGGRAALYDLTTSEEAPTFMENPKGVRFYEFFIRFYSLPQASEWDPTWIFAIAFPIFFGLMLGDAGYGLVILGFSLWMIADFPGRRRIPNLIKGFIKLIMPPSAMRQLAWTLLPAAFIAIGLGTAFDAFFGFRFLPSPFPLLDPTSVTGLSKLLLLSGYIGLVMVTIGFLLGAIKEYFHHHYKATVGKVGGILFAWGIATIGLALLRFQPTSPTSSPGMAIAWAFLVAGGIMLPFEGFSGVMGLIEIISHILSYTRLVGILLASVILAFVIDQISVGMLHSGSLLLLILAPVLLVGGQLFNLILGVFEPGIQGARLIFVEQFSKFYSGNGRPFRPLGLKRTHTAPAPPAAAATGGPSP
ncbi:MAG TPA: V-type ATPase 116kDa subunit family protein, partial [Thermoplasmata archaeon]|nr:V-type ATPase 116kDa subunit family protein [Thermoplasmata archaeon]